MPPQMPTAAEANKRTVDFGNTYLKPLLSSEPPVITKEQFKEILKSVVKSVAASYKGEALDSNPSPHPSPIPSPSPGTSPNPNPDPHPDQALQPHEREALATLLGTPHEASPPPTTTAKAGRGL